MTVGLTVGRVALNTLGRHPGIVEHVTEDFGVHAAVALFRIPSRHGRVSVPHPHGHPRGTSL